MRKFVTAICLSLSGLAGLSCQGWSTISEAVTSPPAIAQSAASRSLEPDVTSQQVADLVLSEQEFALTLYHQIKPDQAANFVYSPYSIYLTMAMVYAGARNQTETEMMAALKYTLPQQELHPAFNALDLSLTTPSNQREPENSSDTELIVANTVWAQSDYSFLPEYLDTLAVNYDSGIRLLNYAENPAQARATINEWISENTRGKIESLIPPDLIKTDTRLVLANALYLSAVWERPFRVTTDGAFTLVNGEQVMVPTMSQTARFRVATGEDYQSVELSYQDSFLSMIIVLPPPGQFQSFEANLNAARINEIADALQAQSVDLSMPKFGYASSYRLAEGLKALGMTSAFSEKADFSGMAGTTDLHLDEVVHETFINVDELGTEAAASTASVVTSISAAEPDFEIKVDRPFIFLIWDSKSRAILLAGRVMDPS